MDQDHQSRAIDHLCALAFGVLRPAVPGDRLATRRRGQLTPAALASLLLGAALAMMLCGSVTFVIGFILMPWVIGLGMLFYFVGILSSISGIGRSVLCQGGCDPSMLPRGAASPKEIAVYSKDSVWSD